jgi:hypothetical protein
MLIETYRNIPRDLLLALVRFDIAKKIHLDRQAYVSHFYSVTDEQAIWEITDRNKRDIYMYALKKVPDLKLVKREAARIVKRPDLYFVDTLEPTKFDKSELKKITGDPEIVGRYVVPVGKVFIFVLHK